MVKLFCRWRGLEPARSPFALAALGEFGAKGRPFSGVRNVRRRCTVCVVFCVGSRVLAAVVARRFAAEALVPLYP